MTTITVRLNTESETGGADRVYTDVASAEIAYPTGAGQASLQLRSNGEVVASYQPGSWLFYEAELSPGAGEPTEEDVAAYAAQLCQVALGADIGSDDVTPAQRSLITACARQALADGADVV